MCVCVNLQICSLPTTWDLILSCLAELWSSVTRHPRISLQEGCCPKPVPHRGNQPYCSCRGKQAPGLVPLRFCCRAPGCTKGRMTLKCFPLERQLKPRQTTTSTARVDSAAAADLWSFDTHGRSLLFSPPSPRPSLPPSLLDSFSLLLLC